MVAENFNTAKKQSTSGGLPQKGIEVLLLSDRVDDWLMNHIQDFDGKAFQDVARGALDLAADTEEEKAEQEKLEKDSEALVERMAKVLDAQVDEVRATSRLTESPACLVVGEHDMGAQMRRIMEAAGQDVPEQQAHSRDQSGYILCCRCWIRSRTRIVSPIWRSVIFDQAHLAEGGQLDDPRGLRVAHESSATADVCCLTLPGR